MRGRLRALDARRVVFVVPGSLETPTGGYVYDRRLIEALERRGWSVTVVCLAGNYPLASPAERASAAEIFDAIETGARIIVDGLALGALPQVVREQKDRLRLVALVHHPLGMETGLEAAVTAALLDSEAEALRGVAAIVTTSGTTRDALSECFAIASERVVVARPGLDEPAGTPDRATPRPNGTVTLLAVGSVIARKGYDILVGALERLEILPWRCLIIGSLDHDPSCAAALRAQIAAAGLDARVTLAGAMSAADVRARYAAADLFVQPSRLEGFGMAALEAQAYGLPVVATRAGALPEALGLGAWFVPVDDVEALAEALGKLIANEAQRRAWSQKATKAAAGAPGWDDTAAIVEGVLLDLAA